MEPTTGILLSASAVLLVVVPNAVLFLSLKRRKRDDDRLTELMDRLSSSHEVLEALLPETGANEVDRQKSGGGPDCEGRVLAIARPAPTNDGDRFEQIESLVASVSSANSGGVLSSATSAGSEAGERRSVESLVKAISDRAERQQAQAAAAVRRGKGRRKSSDHAKRVRSRLQRCLRKRVVLVLVPAAVATAIAFLVVKPDPMGAVSVSVSGAAAQFPPSGLITKPVVAGVVEAANSPQGAPSMDPRASGAASPPQAAEVPAAGVSEAPSLGASERPQPFSVDAARGLGGSRRAAELFPELAADAVSASAVVPEAGAQTHVSTVTEAPAAAGKHHAGSPVPPPGHSGPSASAPDGDDESSSLASAMRPPAVPRRVQPVAPRQIEPAGPRAVKPAVPRAVESAGRSDRKVARARMIPLVAGATRGRPLSSRGNAASSRTEYNRGVELFSARRYREAIEVFKSLIASDLHTSLVDNCYYWIGESYFAIREFREGRNHFEKVLKMRGTNKALDSRMGLAYCLLELGDTGRAIEELSRVARTSPDGNQAMRARDLALHLKQASDASDMPGREVGSSPASPMVIP